MGLLLAYIWVQRPTISALGIFCEKIEVKSGIAINRETERDECFPSWKNIDNAWEQIALPTQKMGLDRLHQLKKDVDLFAVETKHHPSGL